MSEPRGAAAIYCRISLDKEGAGLGVQRQETECRELAERLGLTVAEVFTDNDTSASTGKRRPGYEALLDGIASGRFDAVIAWHGDRLHRRTVELERYIEVAGELPTYSVTSGTHDLTTPAGRATAKTVAAWAQAEVEQKAERQRSKNRQVAASGKMPPGGPVPFGFMADRQTADPVQAEMIRSAHKALLGGASLGSIIRRWNDSGTSAPRGGHWTYSTVRGVLTRPLNAGLVFYDGRILPEVAGQWDALVSAEEHYAVVELLSDPARRTTTGKARRHLLAGIAHCGSCCGRMKSGSVGSRGRKSFLYRCHNAACTARVNVARDQLDAEVERRFLAERGLMKVVHVKTMTGPDAEGLADIEARIKSVTARLGDDGADMVALLARLDELKSERAEAKQALARPVIETSTVAEEWAKAETLERRQELLLGHLSPGGLKIARRGSVTHRFDASRVEIEWVRDDLFAETEPTYSPVDPRDDLGSIPA